MQDPYLNSVLEALASEANADADGPHLISAEELRAAGALDVPASWRNSLRVERDLFSGLLDDEDEPNQNGEDDEPTQEDQGDDETIANLS